MHAVTVFIKLVHIGKNTVVTELKICFPFIKIGKRLLIFGLKISNCDQSCFTWVKIYGNCNYKIGSHGYKYLILAVFIYS